MHVCTCLHIPRFVHADTPIHEHRHTCVHASALMRDAAVTVPLHRSPRVHLHRSILARTYMNTRRCAGMKMRQRASASLPARLSARLSAGERGRMVYSISAFLRRLHHSISAPSASQNIQAVRASSRLAYSYALSACNLCLPHAHAHVYACLHASMSDGMSDCMSDCMSAGLDAARVLACMHTHTSRHASMLVRLCELVRRVGRRRADTCHYAHACAHTDMPRTCCRMRAHASIHACMQPALVHALDARRHPCMQPALVHALDACACKGSHRSQ
jgi:hypothetical protein